MIRIVFSIVVGMGLIAQWTRADDKAAGEPRLGRYNIQSYGATGKPPLFLGYFILSEGGVYKAYLPGDKLTGEGKYQYDAAKKTVVWETGPYKGEWSGGFEIDREGKTQKIRMKRTTIGVNSID